ncbi:MAG: hypothetical protein ACTSXP_15060, partial [Promethearchaeota archaeon]
MKYFLDSNARSRPTFFVTPSGNRSCHSKKHESNRRMQEPPKKTGDNQSARDENAPVKRKNFKEG